MICVNALDQIAPSPEHTNEAQWREQCQSNQKIPCLEVRSLPAFDPS